MAFHTFKRVNTIFLSLSLFCLLMFAACAVVDAQSKADTLGEVKIWADMHQKGDDEQFKRIDTIENRMSDNEVKLETRLSALENSQRSVVEALSAIGWWVRTLALAVVLQLLNLIWRIAVRSKGAKYELNVGDD